MYQCLNKDELKQLLLHLEDDSITLPVSIEYWVKNANIWQDEVGGLSYFLSFIIEQIVDQGEDPDSTINLFYELPNQLYFSIDEFGEKFIEFLIKSLPDTELSLEDNLLQTNIDMRKYDFKRALRY
ncbi:MAG: hypothetical protein WCZ90_02485 [Melioribacteraceae bacterium]